MLPSSSRPAILARKLRMQPCGIRNKSQEPLRSMYEIPGPLALPIVGTLWHYVPGIGQYSFERMPQNSVRKIRKYGPVVREEFVPGRHTIWIVRPEDIQSMYRSEGKYPMRRSHAALAKFRLDRPHVYKTAGLLPTNGPEWHRIRSPIQKYLNRLQNIRRYIGSTDEIMNEFCDHISQVYRNPKTSPPCFLPHLSRLYLELICLVAFDVRLNSFSVGEMLPTSRASLLLQSALETNSSITGTDNSLQFWRWFDTPLYTKLKNAQLYMESVAVEFVQKKYADLKHGHVENPSLLEQLLISDELDYKDVVGFACDLLLAGVDTTSYTTSFTFYHLAQNQAVQERMFKEIAELLPTPNSPITTEVIENAKYTRAVLKESLRLNPIAIGVGRILHTDAIFSGYLIPAHTSVITQNQIACRRPEYFPDPNKFEPQRWMRSDPDYKPVNPYISLPFGHGPRSCVARRLAEQNMHIVLLKMIRNFKVHWTSKKELDCKTLLINVPDSDVAVWFEPRL